MVRLVKGAYWDAEIKRAQIDGLSDFPVFTRKVHTDVSYIACARKLLAATRHVFPQFATHNAQTLAAIFHMAGRDFAVGSYEFQCLHGMGEPLYDEVVGKDKLDRPCRIYAPVGTHETLLAYLVGACSRTAPTPPSSTASPTPNVSIDDLIADPVDVVEAMPVTGMPHDQIALPALLFGKRPLEFARARPQQRSRPRAAVGGTRPECRRDVACETNPRRMAEKPERPAMFAIRPITRTFWAR
jgi:RHH-type proline utilization regulon transcriptional repressor/proline dehydrogenase/delta 1-pyrroline-5-carboxylate dehydrogenase